MKSVVTEMWKKNEESRTHSIKLIDMNICSFSIDSQMTREKDCLEWNFAVTKQINVQLSLASGIVKVIGKFYFYYC